MKFFYAQPERQEALCREAVSWLRTPFMAHGRQKGFGVDCVSLLAEVYIATGLLARWDPPPYKVGAGQHLQASPLRSWLEQSGAFQELTDLESSIAGDLLTFRIGRIDHHVGLKLRGTRFIHVHIGSCVIESDLRDSTYSRRLLALWRPIPR